VPAKGGQRWDTERRRRLRTSLDDARAGLDVEAGGDEGDVGEIEDLGAVGERQGPELRSRTQKIDEALACAGANLGTVWDADEICLAVVAVLAVEVLARGDDEGLDAVPGLRGVSAGAGDERADLPSRRRRCRRPRCLGRRTTWGVGKGRSGDLARSEWLSGAAWEGGREMGRLINRPEPAASHTRWTPRPASPSVSPFALSARPSLTSPVGIVDFSQEVTTGPFSPQRPNRSQARWIYMTDSVTDLLGVSPAPPVPRQA